MGKVITKPVNEINKSINLFILYTIIPLYLLYFRAKLPITTAKPASTPPKAFAAAAQQHPVSIPLHQP